MIEELRNLGIEGFTNIKQQMTKLDADIPACPPVWRGQKAPRT